MIIKYLYWSYPKNTSKDNDKVEKETINHLDERKEMHSNQAGRHAYNIALIVVLMAIAILSLCHYFGIIENANLTIALLGIYAMFQYAIGIFFLIILSQGTK